MFVCYLAADILFYFKGTAFFKLSKTVWSIYCTVATEKLALMDQICTRRKKHL